MTASNYHHRSKIIKSTDIRHHLSPYSILGKRRTTISHAFASALAPYDTFDNAKITVALAVLGQDAGSDLECVYCDAKAQTWDHLVGLVMRGELNGYGHQIGNLVPCCKPCNSRKGNREWKAFLRETIPDQQLYLLKEQQISQYLATYATPIDISHAAALEQEWKRYNEIKLEIFKLMQEADELATRLRITLADKDTG